MSTPANATRLMEAMANAREGKGLIIHDIIEPEDYARSKKAD